MSSMQSTSPIRRYVLLRRRADDAGASRWSIERIGSAADPEHPAQGAGTGTSGVRATLSASTST